MFTQREQTVLQRLGTGASNKQIANDLGITEGTVKQHLHSMFQKSGVGSRAALVLTWHNKP